MDADVRQSRINLGVFDAEVSWRSCMSASLPSVQLRNASLPELALDELLFPWQEECMNLLTLLPVDKCHQQYLCSLRKSVSHSSVFSSVENWQSQGSPANMFE